MERTSNNLIASAVDRPVAVIALVLMVVLFGMLALNNIPIQLTPDVNRPIITITTIWPGAAPAEVEREIVNVQEDELTGLENLRTITATADSGRSRIQLEFEVGTDMQKSLLLISNRLDRVGSYPEEAGSPQLTTSGTSENGIAWFNVVRQPGNERPVHEYGQFVKEIIQDRLERVPGVGEVTVFGGSDPEIQIVINPNDLARYHLTVGEIIQTLRAANVSLSAGDIDEGKRRYIVRSDGELDTVEAVRRIVIRSDADVVSGSSGRIKIEDIADVKVGYQDPTAIIRVQGQPSIPFRVTREVGANVIETMSKIRTVVADLNRTVMPDSGLILRQVYDETVYIDSSIQLVRQNIWVGGLFAALVMLLFLRSIRATFNVSIAIPVSVIGAFVAMAALGRSINVVSLAGLAFAVGMVVDAAIVILENIFRKHEQGHSARYAAIEGARQVWGAVLVSALTTVMVFIPILVSRLEIGQLFRDIAVAISVSVLLSLLVSVTVIPALSRRLLRSSVGKGIRRKQLRIPVLDDVAANFVRFIIGFTKRLVHRRMLALVWVAVISITALFFTQRFLPPLEYLPEGNNNLIFGLIVPPPGYNLETMTGIASNIESAIRPHWVTEGEQATEDPSQAVDELPKIKRFFFVSTRATMFVGAISNDPSRVAELIPVLQIPVFKEPGTFGFMSQPSIFGRGIGAGRKIDLDISGASIEEILATAGRAAQKILTALPIGEGNQFRPNPGLELGVPEVRISPDRLRLADNGLSALELSLAVDVFNDGLRVDETLYEGRLTDITLIGRQDTVTETQNIGSLPVVTPSGRIVPVGSVAEVEITAGPTAIRHRERLRTITLEVRPSSAVAMEEAIELIQTDVIAPLREEGIPPSIQFNLSGTADSLAVTWNAMVLQLIVALIIVFLVMAILFESFIYPLIILLAVPVAAAGGVAGLAILNTFVLQPLDMLTLLGFVILIGIVVNNAILLVHQSLHHYRVGKLDAEEAILRATRYRIRPIFMSTFTSVCGMLPLVLFPGAGSELYRGLGSVVVGGLSMSAILTLFMVPPLTAVFLVPLESRRRRRARRQLEQTTQQDPVGDASGN